MKTTTREARRAHKGAASAPPRPSRTVVWPEHPTAPGGAEKEVSFRCPSCGALALRANVRLGKTPNGVVECGTVQLTCLKCGAWENLLWNLKEYERHG